MFQLPNISKFPTAADTQIEFRGLNRTYTVGETEFADMLNMSSENYPVLSPRRERASGTLNIEGEILDVITHGEDVYYVYTDGTNVYFGDGVIRHELSTEYVAGLEYMHADKGDYIFISPKGRDPKDYNQFTYDTRSGNFTAVNFRASFEYEAEKGPAAVSSEGSYIIRWDDAARYILHGDVIDISFPRGDSAGAVTSSKQKYRVEEVSAKDADPGYIIVSPISTDVLGASLRTTKYMVISRDGIRLDYVTSYNNRLFGCAKYSLNRERKKYPTFVTETEPFIRVPENPSEPLLYASFYLDISEEEAERLDGKQFTMTSSFNKLYSGIIRFEKYDGEKHLALCTVNGKTASPDLVNNQNYNGDETYIIDFGGEEVNTIFVSSPDSAQSWTNYDGTSLGSYYADVSSEGEWTGIKAFDDNVWFFKEDRAYQLYGDTPPFGYNEILYTGVKKGSSGSVHVIGNTMYYHTRDGMAALSNGGYGIFSQKLGDAALSNVKCASIGTRLYVACEQNENYVLYVFDTEKGLWHKEDNFKVDHFLQIGKAVGAITTNINSGAENKLTWLDARDRALSVSTVKENAVRWMAETGDIGWYAAYHKRLIRLNIRADIPIGGEITVEVSYDGGDFEVLQRFSPKDIRLNTFRVFPRRCDHFRLRFRGEGDCRIISVTKTIEGGSDIVK